MSALLPVFQSSYLYEIELAKTKLASRDIPSYIKNEYVNNIAVFPISQNYFLLVNERDFEVAVEILQENNEVGEE
ncbi:putative signal transducing protein [Kaistella sp.]|uniref:putative signal transducing protein n=1 Tax=Kaistella sp. TaxID=2782235 RepID=UPI002F92C4E4